MNDDNIAIRLKFLIEKLGITSSQFADACKIPRPTFSQILNGRNKKISDQIIRSIHEAYPDVSISWLLFNEGEILNDTNPINGETSRTNDRITDGDFPNKDISRKEASSLQNMENENLILSDNGSTIDSDERENGVNYPSKHSEAIIKEEVKTLLKSNEILNEIAKKTVKCRKVVSVTIYYDDSTFETFRPT